ncbi:hypothetical protein [Actinomadura sp. KC216]|uniref:hypothetical protein n=1 Tax=Actinomadura sp. KC216 TaxID=2530370 RepID=UPI00140548C9|nr:hypothetical protein [Actinomadura sp. KC216]
MERSVEIDGNVGRLTGVPRVHDALGGGEPLAVLLDFDDVRMPGDERESVVRRGPGDRAAREKAVVNLRQNLVVERFIVVVEVGGESVDFRIVMLSCIALHLQSLTPDPCLLPKASLSAIIRVKACWVVAIVLAFGVHAFPPTR